MKTTFRSLRNKEPERCYVCQQPMIVGQPSYELVDDAGLRWVAHQTCAENAMEVDPTGGGR